MDLKFITTKIGLKLLFLICLTNTNVAYTSVKETICSASRNEKWNKIKKTCVTCSDCSPGYFRNLTENYDGRHGDHGDEQCLPCKPCPKGTFSENGHGECSSCRMNCTEMFREYDSTCSSTHDAKCGSCLTNYEDTYGHFLFPCSPKKHFRFIHRDGKDTMGDSSLNTADQTPHVANGPKMSDRDIAILAVSVVAAVVVVVPLAMVVVFRKIRNRRSDVVPRHGSYDTVDTDLETDAAREDTVPKVYTPLVRAEIGTETQPEPRPELPQPISPLSQLNGLYFLQFPDHTVVSVIYNGFCTCSVDYNCDCPRFFFPNLPLEKSDEYITTTASEICHDFLPLFRKLGLTPPILYQENDSRNRDPEKITQKELVLRLLNIWIETKSTSTTLRQLSIALCYANFHKINTKLFTIYTKSLPKTTDNQIDQTCSM